MSHPWVNPAVKLAREVASRQLDFYMEMMHPKPKKKPTKKGR